MGNTAGASAQAKHFADQNHVSSDAEEIRDNIKDLGSSVGDMATRQYERAHDTVTDSLQEAESAVRRNPLTAILAWVWASYSAFSLVDAARQLRGIPREFTP